MNTHLTNTENETRFTLRLPPDLYEWLKQDAKRKRRSLNSQVVEFLDSYRLTAGKGQHSGTAPQRNAYPIE